jgi:NAD(P)-dependent dehydrogenase (short-subunit alcohol dehydrogenase family)
MNTKRFLTIAAAAAGTALLVSRDRRRKRRIDFRGASVVVTGGSRGLGLEIARRFAAEGARLTLVARNAAGLERARAELEAKGASVRIFACDLGRREEAETAIRFALDAWGSVDVLVNNAGVIQVGPYDHMEIRDFEEAMAVHAWGPLHLVRAAVPLMRGQGGGRIVNITSIGGLIAVPHLLPYTMSKFALVGLSDGLRAELAKDNIRVTTVAPGLMRTGSHINAVFKGQHEKEFAWFAVSDALPLLSTGSEKAASKIVEACRYGDPSLIITPQARLIQAFNALTPGLSAAVAAFAARLLPKPVGPSGNERKSGRESRSAWAPPYLTRPADRMIERNLEG